MKNPCDRFADQLIDYVDGELSEDEANTIARHAATCENCRRTIHALERSLKLAKVIWSDNLGDSESVPRSEAIPNRCRIRLCAVAASVLVAVAAIVITASYLSTKSPSVPFDQVQKQIAREGVAAELLAATKIITGCEATEAIVDRQYRFILQEYADTPAAESIRAHYSSHKKGGTQ